MDRFIIVSGGPGAGKTALITALAGQGFAAMPEAGRAIIQDQVAIGGTALPWKDRAAFAELMLGWDMRSYRMATALGGTILFDRGIPDIIGYLSLCGLPVPAHLNRAAALFRYRRTVFVAPPWKAIFIQDEERRQDFTEACATHDAIVAAYHACGYHPVALPLASIADRARLVTAAIG